MYCYRSNWVEIKKQSSVRLSSFWFRFEFGNFRMEAKWLIWRKKNPINKWMNHQMPIQNTSQFYVTNMHRCIFKANKSVNIRNCNLNRLWNPTKGVKWSDIFNCLHFQTLERFLKSPIVYWPYIKSSSMCYIQNIIFNILC